MSSAPTAPAVDSAGSALLTGLVSVNGAQPGDTASLVVRAPPGATCSISYTTPAGTRSTARGLIPKTASANGQVSWNWVIGSSTRPGTGRVEVSCSPGGVVTTPISIG